MEDPRIELGATVDSMLEVLVKQQKHGAAFVAKPFSCTCVRDQSVHQVYVTLMPPDLFQLFCEWFEREGRRLTDEDRRN